MIWGEWQNPALRRCDSKLAYRSLIPTKGRISAHVTSSTNKRKLELERCQVDNLIACQSRPWQWLLH